MSVINEITIDKFIFELKGKINEEDYIYIKILNKTINYTFYVYRSNSDLGVFRYAMYIMGYRKQFYKGKNMSKSTRVGGVAVDQLKSIILRIEKLEEEKAAISDDIKDVFAEAKGNGFDVKALRQILKLRKMDAQEREEEETILDTYLRALGMLPELEDAA